jgi:nucleotide-binding universal stress UspA family protein
MSGMKVLVLVDGQHSRDTLDRLSRLLELTGTELLLAYIEGPSGRAGLEMVRGQPVSRPMPPHRERELHEAEEVAGEAAIADAEAAARDHGAKTETIRIAGKPGHTICALADELRADLVVVRAGGKDRPPIGPGSLGPAARFIADHCRAPVLLLRTG